MKKLYLCVIVLATLMVAGVVSAATTSFSDVSTDDWFYDDVMNMAAWDVIRGYPDGTFGPANQVNRAELSAMWNRYDKHVEGMIPGTPVDASSLYIAIGDLYLGLALEVKNEAMHEYYFLRQESINASLSGTVWIKDCSWFRDMKRDMTDYIAKAKQYTNVDPAIEADYIAAYEVWQNACDTDL